jgi:hypothetical protein
MLTVLISRIGVTGMESKPTDTAPIRDDELNAALEEHVVEDLDHLDSRNLRLARVQEHEEESISRSNPFAAMIGWGTADLQRVFDCYSRVILHEIDNRNTLAEIRELNPDIRLLLKLREAIETDLEFAFADDGQPPAFCTKRIQDHEVASRAPTGKRNLIPKRWTGNN